MKIILKQTLIFCFFTFLNIQKLILFPFLTTLFLVKLTYRVATYNERPLIAGNISFLILDLLHKPKFIGKYVGTIKDQDIATLSSTKNLKFRGRYKKKKQE